MFYKKEARTQALFIEFSETSKNTYFTEHLQATVSILTVLLQATHI